MSWLRYEMSQSGYSSFSGNQNRTKPAAHVEQNPPLTVNVNYSFCSIDLQTKPKPNPANSLFVSYKKKQKSKPKQTKPKLAKR